MVRIETPTTREDAGAIMAVRFGRREKKGWSEVLKLRNNLKLDVDVGSCYGPKWDAAGILWRCCATYKVQAQYKGTWRNILLEFAICNV